MKNSRQSRGQPLKLILDGSKIYAEIFCEEKGYLSYEWSEWIQ